MKYYKIDALLGEINEVRKILNKKENIKLQDVGFAIYWCHKFYKDILEFDTNTSSDNRLSIYNYIYDNYISDYHIHINSNILNGGKTFISRLNTGKLKLENHTQVLNWYFSIKIIDLFRSIIRENIQLPKTNKIINDTLFKMYQESYYNDNILLVDDTFWLDENETSINEYLRKYLRKNSMEKIYLSVFEEMLYRYKDDFDAKNYISSDIKISEEKKISLGKDIYEYAIYKFDKYL